MKWKLEEIARVEERKGKRVWVRRGGIRIEDKWWRWDEDNEVLRDERGMVREEKEEGIEGEMRR